MVISCKPQPAIEKNGTKWRPGKGSAGTRDKQAKKRDVWQPYYGGCSTDYKLLWRRIIPSSLLKCRGPVKGPVLQAPVR